MRVITAVSGILAFAFAAGATVLDQKNTPQYALGQIEKALATRDARLLERHVDVEAVIGSAVDELLAASEDVDAGPHADTSPGGSPVEGLRPVVLAMARDALLDEFYTSPHRPTMRDILEIRREGDRARARVLLEETQFGTALVLTFELEKRAGEWRLVAISDLGDYVRMEGRGSTD